MAIAMIIVLLMLDLIIVGMVLGSGRHSALARQRVDTVRAFYAAESGVNMSLRELVNDADEDGDGTIGTISDDGNDANGPDLGTARVHVTQTLGPLYTTLNCDARVTDARRSIDVVLR
ncbi:MAG: hypothetical protein GY715_19115 [Planctomycetes bacterium]|nr:hypothetical protein [Planctomycetota bacterium]